MKTKRKVLYEVLEQAIMPYKEAILDNFDDIYNVSKEDKIADKDYNYLLSDFLQFAADIAFEVEATKYDDEHTSIIGHVEID